METSTAAETTKKLSEGYDEFYIQWERWHPEGFGIPRPGEYIALKKDFETIQEKSRVMDPKLPEIKKVLEIGYGDGRFLGYGRSRGWEMTGVEINPHLVEMGKKAGYNTLHVDDLPSLKNEEYDVVAAYDVLEHVEPDELPALLSVLRQKLKIGGVVVAQMPNGASPFGLHNHVGDVTHKIAFNYNKADYFARKAGLRVVYTGAPCQSCQYPPGRWPWYGWAYFVRRLSYSIAKTILDWIGWSMYSDAQQVIFASQNLLFVLKRIN